MTVMQEKAFRSLKFHPPNSKTVVSKLSASFPSQKYDYLAIPRAFKLIEMTWSGKPEKNNITAVNAKTHLCCLRALLEIS